MRIQGILAGSSIFALMAGTALAQTPAPSTVQDNGQDNKALVENTGGDNERNSSLIIFNGNGNRATVSQTGFDHASSTQHQGDLNTSWVRQQGYRNSATLLQVGYGNGSSIDQYLDPRIGRYPDRIANVEQRGDLNSSSVVQVNGTNSATVRQGTASETSIGGVSTIYQISSGNQATVTMVGGYVGGANRSHVEQMNIDPIFTNSSATVNMSGTFNLSYLYQVGSDNLSTHSVTGTQNTIIGKSYGNSNSSSVIQEGYRNFATLNQYAGSRNFSSIEQRGASPISGANGDRQVYVSQGGSDNSSSVIQSRQYNNVVVNQNGYGTVSGIIQDGESNIARVSLWNGSVDALNESGISQRWNFVTIDSRHVADVTIRGFGNKSGISQTGFSHSASVDMAGGGVGTNEEGRLRGNSVMIDQEERVTQGIPSSRPAGHSARVRVGLLEGGGVGTVTSIVQLGQHASIGNDAVVRQEGQYDNVSLLQSTRFVEVEGGAVANIATRGVLNGVTLRQFGREIAFITQGLGRESFLAADQYDTGGSRRSEGLFAGGRGSNDLRAAQYGDRNSIASWQEGADNRVILWQTVGSSDNLISVNQGRTVFQQEVEGFRCDPRCEFANNAIASVTQSGQFNIASVTQYGGGGRASITQQGTGTVSLRNIARITQFNSSAEARISQTETVGPSQPGDPSSGAPGDPSYFGGGARASEARIRQGAGAVSARIEQRGKGQYAFIDQTGANIASILQDVGATNATAIITQGGSGNSYNVIQTQPGQYINVSQTGMNNSVTDVISRP